MRYQIVWNPGTPQQIRQPFTISEADIDEASAFNRAPADLDDVAYFKAVFSPPKTPEDVPDDRRSSSSATGASSAARRGRTKSLNLIFCRNRGPPAEGLDHRPPGIISGV